MWPARPKPFTVEPYKKNLLTPYSKEMRKKEKEKEIY